MRFRNPVEDPGAVDAREIRVETARLRAVKLALDVELYPEVRALQLAMLRQRAARVAPARAAAIGPRIRRMLPTWILVLLALAAVLLLL